ncbi:SDR family NAD(P)-dependent oxidoreductase [uncultured Methylobacterium sp.]|jgi:NAD(P)-dependent dehydrogenase (short-subunit alcohol dehydrogenase family)|uniref:SDR family NAD(P)-dependent oxidoreductase n=1 Tax=uncultured Methylobacterium sp. TaxID=157278 RepID=UPI0026253067|nr:SDR family NAD(P)-dependent oxidoreductase [uncultured Methylobacterium sp.]
MTDGIASAVVTGASSGIGFETVRLLAGRGTRVFGSVRDAGGADRLRALGPVVTPLILDVRDPDAVARAARQVGDALDGHTLGGLVNNAGVAIPGPVLAQPADEIREQIETNLIGAITVTRAFAPLLGADRSRRGPPGRIVMMSSIAGILGQPFLSGYVAAKHGLEGFSDTLRRELQLLGIDVVVIGPATVATPIWDKAMAHLGRYAGTPYGEAFDRGVRTLSGIGRDHGLAPEAVAGTVWTALTARAPAARYAPARHPLVEQGLARIAPRRLLDRLFGRVLGLRPQR